MSASRRVRRAGTKSAGALDATLSVLNAVVGDYLRRRANPLGMEFGLYHHGQPLPSIASSDAE